MDPNKLDDNFVLFYYFILSLHHQLKNCPFMSLIMQLKSSAVYQMLITKPVFWECILRQGGVKSHMEL